MLIFEISELKNVGL